MGAEIQASPTDKRYALDVTTPFTNFHKGAEFVEVLGDKVAWTLSTGGACKTEGNSRPAELRPMKEQAE